MTASQTLALRGERVRLRPPSPTDLDRLTAILTEPAVAKWWGSWDRAKVQRELLDSSDDTVILAIETDGQLVGIIQYLEETDPDYRHAGMDIFLDPACHGQGLGPDAIRTVARHLFDDRGHHRLTIDPAAHNQRAIRAYQRVGFLPVGRMRNYERSADGTWHDGLLMDLLRAELT